MKALFISITTILVSSIITFSQTSENAASEVQWIIKPLELPADNVELVSKDGRKITVTVLEVIPANPKLYKGSQIKIRKDDGTEAIIEAKTLHPDSADKILGVAGRNSGPRTPKTKKEEIQHQIERYAHNNYGMSEETKKWHTALLQEQLRAEEIKESMTPEEYKKVIDELKAMNLNTRQAQWKNKEMHPIGLTNLKIANLHFEVTKAQTADPNQPSPLKNVRYDRSINDIFLDLDLNNPVTEFSLRPKFEKLGVEGIEQVGPECVLAAVHNLAKFAALNAGMEPKSKEELKTAYFANGYKTINGAYTPESMISTIEKAYGKKPTIVALYAGDIAKAVAKHEICMGRPILGSIRADGEPHQIVITGFKPSGSVYNDTDWEYLDSNHIHKNGAYKTTRTPMLGYSIRFE